MKNQLDETCEDKIYQLLGMFPGISVNHILLNLRTVYKYDIPKDTLLKFLKEKGYDIPGM